MEFSSVSVLQPTDNAHLLDKEEDVPCTCQWEGCQLRLQNLQQLVSHIEHAHTTSLQNYVCLWRGCVRDRKPFDARYKLITHLRCHTGERPYHCTHGNCSRKFSRLENLKLHMRTHTGEKPYLCHHADCGKKFNNTSDRAKHMKTHITRKPYLCRHPGCNKAYTDPSSMRKHVKFAHKAKATPTSDRAGPSMSHRLYQTKMDSITSPMRLAQTTPTSNKSMLGGNTPVSIFLATSPSSTKQQSMYMMMPVIRTTTNDEKDGKTIMATSQAQISPCGTSPSGGSVSNVSTFYQLNAPNTQPTHSSPLITLPSATAASIQDQTTHQQYMLLQQQPTSTAAMFSPQVFNSHSGQLVSIIPHSNMNQYLQPLLKTTLLPKPQQPLVISDPTSLATATVPASQLSYPPLLLSPVQPVQPVIVPVLPLPQQPFTKTNKP